MMKHSLSILTQILACKDNSIQISNFLRENGLITVSIYAINVIFNFDIIIIPITI